jgi:hypothetical protein
MINLGIKIIATNPERLNIFKKMSQHDKVMFTSKVLNGNAD